MQVGQQGAFVVDTGAGKLSDKVIEAIAKAQRQADPVHRQHQLPSRIIPAATLNCRPPAPIQVLSGSFFSLQFADAGQGATIIGHLNTQVRMQDHKLPATPSDTFEEDRRRKYHNGEPVEIFPQPPAITDGDSIVHFRRSDVIVTGDIFTTTQYPFIDVKNGGSLQGEIQALNFILDRNRLHPR